jgi:putative sterol carrier protein
MSAYFTLKELADPEQRDLGRVFQRMADRSSGSGDHRTRRAQFRIVAGDGGWSCWSLEVGPAAASLRPERVELPDFEIITDADTWWRIAAGELAPLRAFFQGKLRVLGDVSFGESFLRQFAAPSDAT